MTGKRVQQRVALDRDLLGASMRPRRDDGEKHDR